MVAVVVQPSASAAAQRHFEDTIPNPEQAAEGFNSPFVQTLVSGAITVFVAVLVLWLTVRAERKRREREDAKRAAGQVAEALWAASGEIQSVGPWDGDTALAERREARANVVVRLSRALLVADPYLRKEAATLGDQARLGIHRWANWGDEHDKYLKGRQKVALPHNRRPSDKSALTADSQVQLWINELIEGLVAYQRKGAVAMPEIPQLPEVEPRNSDNRL